MAGGARPLASLQSNDYRAEYRAQMNRARNAISVIALFFVIATTSVVVAAPAQGATAVINNVSMRAPVHTSYNHQTGGGAYNTGATTYVKGELLGTNYACGDVTTYLMELSVAASPTMSPPPYTAEITIDFTTDSTGQSGVALQPLVSANHLRVNNGAIAAPGVGTGTGNSDGGFAPSGSGLTTSAQVVSSGGAPVATVTQMGGAVFTSGSKARLVFSVSGLGTSTTTIVRSDARILCKPYSSPTGNLQVSLAQVRVTSPGVEAVSAGNQTVNFRGVGNLSGLGVPDLELVKEVYDYSQNPSCPQQPTGSTSITTTNASIQVLYCYYLTNYGTADATNVTIVDNNADASTTPTNLTLTGLSGTTLLAGATARASLGPITWTGGGSRTNIATASSNGGTYTSVNQATVNVNNGAVLTKTVTTATGTCPGSPLLSLAALTVNQTVKYCYSITNYSANPITGVSLTDDFAGLGSPQTITLSGLTNGDLPSGQTATGEITQTFTPSEQTTNQVAEATPTWDGSTHTPSETTVIFAAPVPHVTLDKLQTSVNVPSQVGDTIVYSITGLNDGDLDLTALNVTDPNAALSNCSPTMPIATFAIGDTFTCTATHTVTQSDLDAGFVLNEALLSATTPNSSNYVTSSPIVNTPVIQSPAITTTKSATSTTAKLLGEAFTYQITATNTGNVTLTNVTVTDANATITSCTPSAPATLAPGAAIVCQAVHVLTVADLLAGSVVNEATASGQPPGGGNPVTDNSPSVTTNITPSPKLDAVIEPDGPPPTQQGQTARYLLRLRNSGNLRLLQVTPQVTGGVIGNCTPTAPGTLDPNDEMVCEVTHIVTAEDVARGTIIVSGSGTSVTANGTPVDDVTGELISPLTLPATGSDSMTLASSALLIILAGFGLVFITRIATRQKA